MAWYTIQISIFIVLRYVTRSFGDTNYHPVSGVSKKVAGNSCWFIILFVLFSAICLPPCLHHGLCIKPDKCKCQVAYTGRTCKYKKHRRVLSSNAILRNKRNRKMRASVIQSIYTRTVSSTRPISKFETRKDMIMSFEARA